MRDAALPHANAVLTRRYFLSGVGTAAALPLCGAQAHAESRPILRQRWRVSVELHSPTNVVIGRLDKETRSCSPE